GRRLLDALFGNSPFLSHCCLHEAQLVRDLLQRGPDATFAELIERLNRHSDSGPGEERAALMAELRIARRRTALIVGIADIAGLWRLGGVTAALSAFAEAALGRAVSHLLAAAASAGELAGIDPADPARGSGLIVLGMGKLGARELNYSSDIDLIVLYET